MINVLLDNVIFSKQIGGGASVVWYEHITRLLKDPSFDVEFFEYSNAITNKFRRDLCLQPQKVTTTSDIFFKLKKYINFNSKKNSPYVFHSSYYRIDRCKFAKNVTTVHDFVYEYFVHGIRRIVHSTQKWNAIKKSDAIICISENTKKDLLHFLPQVEEDKIHVIYNGVSNDYMPMKQEQYKLNLPFETGEYILYIGMRRDPYKNFKLAVDVCSNLKRPLIMIGGETLIHSEMEYLNGKLGENKWKLMRGVRNMDLNEIYNRSCCLLYPSLYEGFGIPVIEAQKSGTPVICFNTSSIPEVAGNTDLCLKGEFSEGAVCEAINALETASFKKKEIEHGLINSHRFSWDSTYQNTSEVYKKVIGYECSE